MKSITIPITMLWSIAAALVGGTITLATMVWNQSSFQTKVLIKLNDFDKSQDVIQRLLTESDDTKVFKQFILIRVNQADGKIAIIEKKVDGLYGYEFRKRRSKD